MKVLLFFCVLFSSCITRLPQEYVRISPTKEELKSFASPFAPLPQTARQSWHDDYKAGLGFLRQGDFERAVTEFKRCAVLMPEDDDAQPEVAFWQMVAHFGAHNHPAVLACFHESTLSSITAEFPAYSLVLCMLYESSIIVGDTAQASASFSLLEAHNASRAALLKKSLEVRAMPNNDPSFLQKNPKTAAQLNAVIPGAGYAYVGQKQTALTSFVLNALFTAAAIRCFETGHVAAGAILTGFELGWYVGGINGAQLSAQRANRILYEDRVHRDFRHLEQHRASYHPWRILWPDQAPPATHSLGP